MAKIEVCWYLTTRCNQRCKYCHRFLNVNELDFEKNEKILRKLIDDGIEYITWTGGEALLYPNFIELLKIAKENGIKSKLITNGTLVAGNNDIREVCNYLDSITLSIDSISNEVNDELGRGYNHFNNIKTVLEYLKDKDLKVNINTVASKASIDKLEEVGEFISNYNVYSWRIFKFIPLRETAKVNKDKFEITEEEFNNKKKSLERFADNMKIEYRQDKDFENKYVLIMSNGDVIKTEQGEDIKIGNVLEENLINILNNLQKSSIVTTVINKGKEFTMNKIRTLVAHEDDSIKDEIVNAIKVLDYVDVVATAKNAQETFDKIIEYKPQMVFTEYYFPTMSGLDIMKKSIEQLNDKAPVFNMIADSIPDNEMEEAVTLEGRKMNTIIRNRYPERYVDIMKDYKEYINL